MKRIGIVLLWMTALTAPIWAIYAIGAFLTLDPLWFAWSHDMRVGSVVWAVGIYGLFFGFLSTSF